MRIQYAVSTMLFWWRENHLSFEQECQFLDSLGYGIELWPTMRGDSECRYRKRNWSRLQEATKNMLVVMRSRGDNPTLAEWIEQIECAKLLGASIVADLSDLGIPDGSNVNGCDFCTEIVETAQRENVKLCVETGCLSTIEQIGKKFPSIGYCLDVGYAHIDNNHSFKEYVDHLADRVTHLHLSDNHGTIDDHEPPGLRGGIPREDWDYLLHALEKYDNDIVATLEMFPCMPSVMIRSASKFLFDELQWPNAPESCEVTAELHEPK